MSNKNATENPKQATQNHQFWWLPAITHARQNLRLVLWIYNLKKFGFHDCLFLFFSSSFFPSDWCDPGKGGCCCGCCSNCSTCLPGCCCSFSGSFMAEDGYLTFFPWFCLSKMTSKCSRVGKSRLKMCGCVCSNCSNFFLFSRVHATLHLAVSVGRSVCRSVGRSVRHIFKIMTF